jgi:hypothetical protein
MAKARQFGVSLNRARAFARTSGDERTSCSMNSMLSRDLLFARNAAGLLGGLHLRQPARDF